MNKVDTAGLLMCFYGICVNVLSCGALKPYDVMVMS